jgi:hypothetical protein
MPAYPDLRPGQNELVDRKLGAGCQRLDFLKAISSSAFFLSVLQKTFRDVSRVADIPQ